MFVTKATVQESRYSYHYETSCRDRQWYWNHAVKFAGWQHLQWGAGRGLLYLTACLLL